MAENLIRLKQLNQPEITGLVQNIIQSNQYALTYNGGTGLNIGNVGGINLDNILINISGSKVNFDKSDVNLAYQFPASTGARRYYPESLQSLTSAFPASGTITYFPFLIRKKIKNPQACIEMVTSTNNTNQDTPIKIGLYSGNNGFEGSRLFWSGEISVISSTSTGINRIEISRDLDEGPYIVASLNYSTINPCQFRVMNANSSRLIFGENINLTIFGGIAGSTSTAFYMYETGINLNEIIGTGLWSNSPTFAAPLVCLEY